MTTKRLKSVSILFLLVVLLVSAQGAGPSRAGDNTWTTTGPFGIYGHDIVIAPDDAQRMYAAASGGVPVYLSTNGGQTWVPSSNGLPSGSGATSLDLHPNDPMALYASTEQGLYMTTTGGNSWQKVNSMAVRSVDITPTGDKIFAVGTSGLYMSGNGGKTFDRIGDETIQGEMAFVRIAPTAPHIMYMAGNFDGLYKSDDGGQSWDRADAAWGQPPLVRDIAFDPYTADTVYVSASGTGLFRTTNGGATWAPVANTNLNTTEITSIVIDPGNQQVIYVSGGEGFSSGIPGVYRSLDNLGLSWEHLVNGMGVRAVHSLAINHEEPQTVYASTGSGIWCYTLVDAPEDYAISINGGALFTSQTAVTLTLTAPPGTEAMKLSNDGGFAGAEWEPLQETREWTITSYGQSVVPRVVYAKFRNAGKISGLYTDDIILDTTPPTGGVEVTLPTSALAAAPPLSWTRAASHTVYLPMAARDWSPGKTVVMLLLKATDDVSGVESMQIGLESDVSDGRWEPYAESKEMLVPLNGTVYVRYRDRAGNVSGVFSDGGW